MGFDSQWRRSGDWVFSTFGAGNGGGWNEGDGVPDRAGPDQRSGDGCDSSCGCGVCGGDYVCEKEGCEGADEFGLKLTALLNAEFAESTEKNRRKLVRIAD